VRIWNSHLRKPIPSKNMQLSDVVVIYMAEKNEDEFLTAVL